MDTPNPSTGDEPLPPAPANDLPKEADAEALAGSLADNMPKPTADASTVAPSEMVSPGTPETVTPTAEKPDPYFGVRDKGGAGKLWDRTKYKADASGAPLYDKAGFFISVNKGQAGRKNRIEPSVNDNGNPSLEPLPDNGGTRTQEAATYNGSDQYDTAAETFLHTGYGIGAAFLSDDFRPEHNTEGKFTAEGKLEHDSLKIPLAAVLREKGSTGLTPTQMFCFALAAYVGKKAAKPTVKERFILLYMKVKGWMNKNKLPPSK